MESVEYRHRLFGWERRWAASGVRRLRARGDPGGFLANGLEAYGYLACAVVWGAAAGLLAVLVGIPLIFIQGGPTAASDLILIVVALLCSMVFVRLLQAKKTRTSSAR